MIPGDGGLVGVDVAGVGPADGDALPQAGPPPDVQVEEAWGAAQADRMAKIWLRPFFLVLFGKRHYCWLPETGGTAAQQSTLSNMWARTTASAVARSPSLLARPAPTLVKAESVGASRVCSPVPSSASNPATPTNSANLPLKMLIASF